MTSTTLFAAVQRAAELGNNELGYRYLDRRERETRQSFQAVADRSARIANGLWDRGVRPGDCVAIVLPTGPDFIDAFFACSHIGAIPVPMYPPVRLGRLDEYYEKTASMLAVSGASILLTDSRAGKLMGQVLQFTAPPLGMCRVEDVCHDEPASPRPPAGDDIAMVQFSSGTTGKPKPVALKHRHVIANAAAILQRVVHNLDKEPSGVSWLPLYHDMGLIGCVFPAVLHPGVLTLIPPEVFLAKPAIWLRALSHTKSVISPAPNFAYALCTERIRDHELDGCDLSHWRYALNGAEPIAPATLRAFQARFQTWGLRPEAMTPVYGLSEASLAITMSGFEEQYKTIHVDREELGDNRIQTVKDGLEITSVGKPLTGFEVEIRSGNGAALPEQCVGRIWAKGPSVMEGYLDGTPPPLVADWLDTGDVGFLHEGELYITGRAKDVIVIRGRNHNPNHIESAVNAVDGVRTGCAAAVGDISENGERVIVFVEQRDGNKETFAERCRQAILAATGIDPDLVIPLDPGTLPRTSSGKIRRSESLKRWKQGKLLAPDTVHAVRVAGAIAKSLWTEWNHRMSRRD